jgi:hypothetical protein
MSALLRRLLVNVDMFVCSIKFVLSFSRIEVEKHGVCSQEFRERKPAVEHTHAGRGRPPKSSTAKVGKASK